MYKLTVEFATKQELRDFLTGSYGATTLVEKPKRANRAKKAETAIAEQAVAVAQEAVATQVTPVATPAAATAPAVAPVAETVVAEPVVALDYAKDVTPVMIAFSTNKGKDAFVALLDSFGVGTARELKPEQFEAFVAEMNAQLGA